MAPRRITSSSTSGSALGPVSADPHRKAAVASVTDLALLAVRTEPLRANEVPAPRPLPMPPAKGADMSSSLLPAHAGSARGEGASRPAGGEVVSCWVWAPASPLGALASPARAGTGTRWLLGVFPLSDVSGTFISSASKYWVLSLLEDGTHSTVNSIRIQVMTTVLQDQLAKCFRRHLKLIRFCPFSVVGRHHDRSSVTSVCRCGTRKICFRTNLESMFE